MLNFNKSSELPAFDIFEKLFQLVFNSEWDDDTVVRTNSKTINVEHISLLLAWPGILEMHLAKLAKNKECIQKLHKLDELLQDNVEYSQIRFFLDNMIESKPIPLKLITKRLHAENSGKVKEKDKIIKQLRGYQPKIFETILLLINRGTPFRKHSDMVRLGSSLGNYYILCCLIADFIGGVKKDAIISELEMQDLFEKMKIHNKNKLDIYFLSSVLMDIHCSNFDNTLNSFINSFSKPKGSIRCRKESINIPSIQRTLHKIDTEAPWTFAIIKKPNDSIQDIDLTSCDTAVNTNLNKYFEYYLWHVRLKKQSSDNGYLKAFFFKDKNENRNDILTSLMTRLYQVAKQSSVAIQAIKESWEEFIDEPTEIVKSNLAGYDNWIFSLLKNYELRDEFFKFKLFSRIIGDLDTDLDYEIIKEVRDEYKDAKRYHIPNELKQKLFKANEELERFIKKVRNTRRKEIDVFWDEEKVLSFFDKNKNQYKYLKLINPDDVKNIKFTSGGNNMRNNRRKILPIINEKLSGRVFEKNYHLTILLGLEPSSAIKSKKSKAVKKWSQ